MTGGQIVYGLTFLTTFPKYECQSLTSPGSWIECNHTYIYKNDKCEDIHFFRIVNGQNNFDNWVEKLNLLCYDPKIIGSVGSMYFIGFGLSSVVIPSLSDKVGKKMPYIASLFV